MRGDEDPEEQAPKAPGGGSGEGVFPPQLGWGLGRGCASLQETFVKFAHFTAVCEDYDSLRSKKFTELK